MSVRRLAEKQPPSFAFTPENLEWAKARMAKYPPGRQQSAVIPILWRAQEQCGGWLPQKAIEATAELLGMARIRVLEVATFYTMFNLAPVGRFHVQFCGTTPCMLRGADALKKVLHKTIGHENEVTADGTLLLGRGRVPRRLRQRADGADQLRLLRGPDAGDADPHSQRPGDGKTPKPGPQVDRQNSAPVGGANTLTDPSIYTIAKSAGQPDAAPHDGAATDSKPA